MTYNKLFLFLSTAAAVASCGGGGSDGGGFPLAAAYSANLLTSRATSFDISGSCAGTGTRSVSAPAAGTFEGAPALVKTIKETNNFSNCAGSGTVTSQDFYDGNYVVLGFTTPTIAYSMFVDKVVVPVTINVGDSGVLGIAKTWTDSSKARPIGVTTYSYAVEPDGASPSSVIAKLISRSVDPSNALASTKTETYRLTASGTLTLLVDDVVRPDGYRITLTVK